MVTTYPIFSQSGVNEIMNSVHLFAPWRKTISNISIIHIETVAEFI